MNLCWPVPLVRYESLGNLDEKLPVAVISSEGTWEAVADRLSLDVVSHQVVHDALRQTWDDVAADVKGDIIYAVGGGMTVDAAKYVSWHTGRPLVSIPTVMSVDAFFTWASGYREDGCVRYMTTTPPDEVIVDIDVINQAPESIRVAGISDVLSIATGRWDWKFAHDADKNSKGMYFDSGADAMIVGILDAALACAEDAGKGEAHAVRRLVECLIMEVQLCNLIGHSRPEEGSEHYFAYAAEEVMGKGLPHGDLVGPGIVIMAALQGQDAGRLAEALKACHVPLDRIPEETVREILAGLPAYCEKHDLPYGIAHTLTDDMIKNLDLNLLS